MSYLVLARKYRPQRFEDLVGQEHVARTLTNAIALGRVHHAFLFTGARGVGKTSAARILARALCCERGPTAQPCGACGPCREIAGGQSVDVQEIDGASNNGVDEVRALRDAARYLPARGPKKVYIIDEVHMLSGAAFNALLKTLEEPPAHVVFVLATTEAHKIPATILSRCQRYDFKLISSAVLAEHLVRVLAAEAVKFDPDAIRVVARQAGGSVRDALSLVDQLIAYAGDEPLTRDRVVAVLGVADRRALFALTEAVLARDAGAALRLLAAAVDSGVDLAQLGHAFLAHLHDLGIAGLVADAGQMLDATAEEHEELRALGRRAAAGLLPALFDRWARAVEEAGKAAAPRLILEMGLVDLCMAEPILPLGDLIERLSGLEARLEVPGGTGPARVAPTPPVAAGAARVAVPPSSPPPGTAPPSPGPRAQPGASPPAEAPSPGPPAAPRPDAGGRWHLVREKFAARPALAAALDHAEVSEWTAGKVTLSFGDRFTAEQVERHRADVERALAEVAGVPTRLMVRQTTATEGAAVLRSEVAREADRAAEDQKRREHEAREHPTVKKAEQLFGARVREVKLL